MDPRKIWICPKCGGRLTDEQHVREGCQRCAEREWEKKIKEKYYTETNIKEC